MWNVKRKKKLCKLKLFHYNYYSTKILCLRNDSNRIAYFLPFTIVPSTLSTSFLSPHIRRMVSSGAWKTISWISHMKLVFMHFWVFFFKMENSPRLQHRALHQQLYIFHLFLLLKTRESFLCSCEDLTIDEWDWRRNLIYVWGEWSKRKRFNPRLHGG